MLSYGGEGMKLKNGEKVTIVYFKEESAVETEIRFKGTSDDMREVNPEWDGFELGERFNLEDEIVRVYGKKLYLADQDSNSEHTYLVGPVGMNASQINYEKLKY